MKVLVQDCDSLKYLNPDCKWVEKPDDAMQFSSGAKAIEFCSECRIPRAQLRLQFPDPRDDITFPISEECREKDR
jgi:hypothetical protein